MADDPNDEEPDSEGSESESETEEEEDTVRFAAPLFFAAASPAFWPPPLQTTRVSLPRG